MPGSMGFVSAVHDQPPMKVLRIPRPDDEVESSMKPTAKKVTIDEIKPCGPGQKQCYKIVLKVKNKKKKTGEAEK